MRMKKPYVATLDQVKISRHGEYGIIEYVELNGCNIHLHFAERKAADTSFVAILTVDIAVNFI